MRIAIVYTSVTANTEETAKAIQHAFIQKSIAADFYAVHDFPLNRLAEYDGLVIGTYTWSGGTIPAEMLGVYEQVEQIASKRMVTGVFGTGDRFFPHFCGAVDEFRDMLYDQTDLAVTLKVELSPQQNDRQKCKIFTDRIVSKLEQNMTFA